MKKYITIVLFLSFMSGIVHAQDYNTKKLDSLFDLLESKNQFMGSVAISHDGKEIYARAIGYADKASNQKATPETKYRIGSITKMFTSVLLLQAKEEGKISLDTPLSTFFPEIKNASEITITNLLNHSSGIFNFTNAMDYLKWNTVAKNRTELMQIIKDGGNVFKPGEKSEYSNSNFVLLTFILEDLYGKSYAELVAEKITKPLGLNATYVGNNIDINNQECNSYTFKGDWTKENETDMSIPVGAGAMVSKPSDLNKFIEGLFTGKLISEESLAEMTTIKEGMGLGIFKFPYKEKAGFGHGGGIDGFSSFLGFLKDDKIAVALTSNGTIYANNEILKPCVAVALGEDFELPSFTTIELSSEDLDAYLGEYTSEQLPLVITLTKDENVLMAQATGQSAFPLSCTEKDVFKFAQAGIIMEFDSAKNQMTLKQGGGQFLFTRK